MFKRLAQFCYRRRRLVVVGWVILLVGLFGLTRVAGGQSRTDFQIPNSESQEAQDLLKERGFSTRSGDQGEIVFEAQSGVNDPAVRQAMEDLFRKIEENVAGISVVSPYDVEGARQIAEDGTIAYAEINFSSRPHEQYQPAADQIKEYRDEVSVPGLRVELGGDMFADFGAPASEIIGVAGAAIILLIAFGSVLAMGLPVVTALFGIGCGVALVGLASRLLDMPQFTGQTTAMLGIGVGIDYALFIVTRYREGLRDSLSPEGAVARAVDTSGRAVLFAGTTVVISLFGIFAMNLAPMRSLAIGASLGVLMTMLAAVSLLPAVLGFVGHNIDRFGLPHRAHTSTTNGRQSLWHRWSRVVQRHPWPALVVSLSLLVVLALPVFSMRFGFGDAGNRPTSDTSRRAYDLLSEGFGPGFNGPFLLAAELPNGSADLDALRRLSDDLNQAVGVAFATPPQANQAGDAAIIQLFPTTSPQDAATTDLVHRLRDEVVPLSVGDSGLDVKVGGSTPGVEDFASYTFDRMPVVMGSVLVLSFLLLLMAFRSLILPLKAVVMNLLSIGAAYGVLVAVFQWGWGKGLVGVGKEGPIEAWAPLMLYAIVFGLSMDYEVFLLSRIREEYDRTRNNGLAVADGLAVTARVITAAAAVMVFVFLSFVLGDSRDLKLFGLGMSVAVFIDATVVRTVLVPAAMELLGDLNWWLPGWLKRVIPAVHIDLVEEPQAEAVEI